MRTTPFSDIIEVMRLRAVLNSTLISNRSPGIDITYRKTTPKFTHKHSQPTQREGTAHKNLLSLSPSSMWSLEHTNQINVCEYSTSVRLFCACTRTSCPKTDAANWPHHTAISRCAIPSARPSINGLNWLAQHSLMEWPTSSFVALRLYVGDLLGG